MKKAGFTLVEVMSVIVILGLIALITIPMVENAVKKGKKSLYDSQIKTIELAAKDWASDNVLNLPKNDGEQIILTVLQLKGAGKLDFNLVDPISEKVFSDNIEITITRNYKNYIYNVIDKDAEGNTYLGFTKVFDTNTPMIELNGSNIVYINQGDTYTDLGCTAKDYNGNNVTCSLIDGNVNIYTPGSYIYTYVASYSDYYHAIVSYAKRTIVVLAI